MTYGKSKVAGQTALLQTGISRFILPFPVLFFPALTNLGLVKLGLMPKNNVACKMIEFTLCMMSLTVALPLACSIYE